MLQVQRQTRHSGSLSLMGDTVKQRSLECNLIKAKKMEDTELCESPERVSQLKGVYGIGENYSGVSVL